MMLAWREFWWENGRAVEKRYGESADVLKREDCRPSRSYLPQGANLPNEMVCGGPDIRRNMGLVWIPRRRWCANEVVDVIPEDFQRYKEFYGHAFGLACSFVFVVPFMRTRNWTWTWS
jgi:hypothetical protein